MTTYALSPFNEDGTPATQAGAHPFQLTTTLGSQPDLADGIRCSSRRICDFHLPPGLVGNPNAASQCTMANFFALVLETNLCPPSSVVGVATVDGPRTACANVITKTVPVFNLVPAQGEPARFGFEVIGKIPVVIDTSVRSGGDYGVDVERQGRHRDGGTALEPGDLLGGTRVILGTTVRAVGNAWPAAHFTTRSESRVPPQANSNGRPS